MCIDMCMDMCMHMCMHMFIDMCVGIDMCIDMCILVSDSALIPEDKCVESGPPGKQLFFKKKATADSFPSQG